MHVEIGAEAAQFPEKEYLNGIAVTVHRGHFKFLRKYAYIFATLCLLPVSTGTDVNDTGD